MHRENGHPLNNHNIGIIVGLVAFCIAIFVFVTGCQSGGQMFTSGQGGATAPSQIEAPMTEISGKPTIAPTESISRCDIVSPMLKGTTVVAATMSSYDVAFDLNLSKQIIATADAPGDIHVFLQPNMFFKGTMGAMSFDPIGPAYMMGNVPLATVKSVPTDKTELDVCSAQQGCLDPGQVLVFQLYDGHWAKLRFISFGGTFGRREVPFLIEITFEWVAQTNDCTQFEGEITDLGVVRLDVK